MGAMAGLNARGVRMPEDLAVIGSATDVVGRPVSPPLSYVRVPDEAVGEHLAALLLDRLTGSATSRPPEQILLPTELIPGGTCGHAGSHAARGIAAQPDTASRVASGGPRAARRPARGNIQA